MKLPPFVYRCMGMMMTLCLCFSLLMVKPVEAADEYEEAAAQYTAAYDAYRASLTTYTKARSEYVTYKTLLAQTQALIATKDFLQKRNQVLLTYLNMIKARLELAKAHIPAVEYESLLISLNTEISWINENDPFINSTENLEDIVSISRQSDHRIQEIRELGYLSKAQIASSKVSAFIATGADLLAVTSEQVQRINRENKLNTDDLERWLLESDQKLDFSRTAYQEARGLIPGSVNARGFSNVRTKLRSSLQYIQSANDQLSETVKTIRVQ